MLTPRLHRNKGKMMRSRSWVLPFLAALALLGTGRAAAQDGALLFVEPAAQTIAPGSGPFEVRLMVDDVVSTEGLGGYTLVMSYDPQVIQAQRITDSGYLQITENTVLCPSSGIDNDDGRLAHFCFTVPVFAEEGPRPVEPSILARITFEPVGEGLTALEIDETTIIDPQGNDLPATTMDGQVFVGTGTSQQPTAIPALDEPDGSAGGSNEGLYIAIGAGAAALIAVVIGITLVSRRRGAGG